MPYLIKEQDILDKTNGGLDIILDLYPSAADSVHQPNKKFKIRDEKTPSAKLNRLSDGTYVVVDFGGGTGTSGSFESHNAVKLYMYETGANLGRAIQELARRYNVSPETREKIESLRSYRPANPEDAEGAMFFEARDSWTDSEIEYIVSKNVLKHLKWKSKKEEEHNAAYSKIAAAFKKYNWHPLVSYSIVKNRTLMTFSSTPDYPIFLWDEGTHKKIYQPKSEEKEYRFMWMPGSKPKGFIHGLKQLEKEFNARKEDATDEINTAAENKDRGAEAPADAKKSDPRIHCVILMAGGSDAINAALLGYRVLWSTNESFKLEGWQYTDINKMTLKFCQLMDIDKTGLSEAHARGMEYLNLHNIELPAALLEKEDSRGYRCKDARDYLNHYSVYDFNQLVENSIPYRFWDEKPMYTRTGDFKGIDYDFNNVHAYNFLQKNGFYRMAVGKKEDEFDYIQIVGNLVRKSNPIRIKHFVKKFLEDRNMTVPLRNAIFRTTQLSDNSLTNLNEIELDFEDFTPFSQLLFFKNRTVEVTAEGLKMMNPKDVDRFVWEKDIYDHRFQPLKEAPFVITKDELGNYDIEIKNYSCMILRFLIQTSRIHWRTELETNLDAWDRTPEEKEKYRKDNRFRIDGPLLSAEEIEEQKSHLINKIFAMGYLMHRYKNRAKAWMAVGMDAKRNSDGKAHGGSGKSIFYDVVMCTLLKSNHQLNGKNPKLSQDEHKYDGLTEHHRYIFLEDAHEYLDLTFLYTDVTGNIGVNPKGKQPYTIPFKKAGKISVTTNYGIKNADQLSTKRRILYTVFSDFYHAKDEVGEYREHHDPSIDFGKQLIDDFNEEEFNLFYNTAAYALSFFLSAKKKVSPAMDNVNVRNLVEAIGQNMLEWADVYFDEEGDNLNRLIIREEVYEDFMFHNPHSKMSAQGWKDRLEKYCRLNGFQFNPTRFLGKKGNIIKKTEQRIYDKKFNIWTEIPGAPKMAKEHFFIQTADYEVPENVQPMEFRQGDLPFND